MEEVLQDKRFAHIAKDPRFRKMPRGEKKVKIDKRFKAMFKDKRFKLKYSVDKRGKPVNLTTNENLKKYYELSSDSEGSEPDEEEDIVDDVKGDVKDTVNESDISSEEESENSDVESDSDVEVTDKKSKNKVKQNTDPRFSKAKLATKEKVKKVKQMDKQEKEKGKSASKSKQTIAAIEKEEQSETDSSSESDEEVPVEGRNDIDYARGEGNIESSSSDDDDDEVPGGSAEVDDDEGIDHRWGEVDENVIELSEATPRLAVCNMDWDRVKAKDIFVLLSSFKPGNGFIKSVKVYMSDFGKERIEEEKAHGPRELKELRNSEDDKDGMDKDGNAYNTEKLRQYQMNRLKYYYAVAECDTCQTANHIYTECDGMEYETSAMRLDLRFIPDDTEFEDEPVIVCSEMPPNYEPIFFINSAMSQSKVDLTWDETDLERVNLTKKQFSNKAEELKEDDLKAYLASSSDEEGPDYGALVENQSEEDSEEEGEVSEDKQIDKYRRLLQDLDQEETKKKEEDVQMEISWEPGLKEATKDLVKKKNQSKDATVWDEYLQKKKEKKKKKREEKKQKENVADDSEESEDEGREVGSSEDEDQAFSDDDIPDSIANDPFFAEELKSRDKAKKTTEKKKKMKKTKKNEEKEETEEDLKEKEALSLLIMDDEKDKKHFNLKKLIQDDGKKKKKEKKKKDKPENEDDFKLNVDDPRFSAMYQSHLFNLDPSAPEYKKTKGNEAIISEKLKRSKEVKGKKKCSDTGVQETEAKKVKLDTVRDESLASLVNSVKAKTKHFHSNKTKR